MANSPWSHDCDEVDKAGIRATARRNDVSTRTVGRWLQKGLPFFQAAPRTKILIRQRDVDEFLTRQLKAHVDLNAMVDDVIKEVVSERTTPMAANTKEQRQSGATP